MARECGSRWNDEFCDVDEACGCGEVGFRLGDQNDGDGEGDGPLAAEPGVPKDTPSMAISARLAAAAYMEGMNSSISSFSFIGRKKSEPRSLKVWAYLSASVMAGS